MARRLWVGGGALPRSTVRCFILKGGGARDRIDAGAGRDVVKGNAGKDRIKVAGDRDKDKVSCGKGKDTVVADRKDKIGNDCERVQIRGKKNKK